MFYRQRQSARQWYQNHKRDIKLVFSGAAAASLAVVGYKVRKNSTVKTDEVHLFTNEKTGQKIAVTRTSAGRIDVFDRKPIETDK